jgi:hypothetical protein
MRTTVESLIAYYLPMESRGLDPIAAGLRRDAEAVF